MSEGYEYYDFIIWNGQKIEKPPLKKSTNTYILASGKTAPLRFGVRKDFL